MQEIGDKVDTSLKTCASANEDMKITKPAVLKPLALIIMIITNIPHRSVKPNT